MLKIEAIYTHSYKKYLPYILRTTILLGLSFCLILMVLIIRVILQSKDVVTPIEIQTSQSNTLEMKVMTYNILGSFSDADNDCDKNEKRALNIAKFLTENNYDIIFLQESGCNSVLESMWEKESGKSIDRIDSNYINKQLGILSRYPMEKDLNGKIIYSDSQTYAGDRKTQSVKITTPLGQIRLFNIHPHNFCDEQTHIWQFVSSFNSEKIPHIMGGDYNSGLLSACYPDINLRYIQTCPIDKTCFPSSGRSSSTKLTNPIDHIIFSNNIPTMQFSHITSASLNGTNSFRNLSDHWPVVATVKLIKVTPTPNPTPRPCPTPSPVPTIFPTIQPSASIHPSIAISPLPNPSAVISLYPSPTTLLSPTPIVIKQTQIDLNTDTNVDILDFAKFVEYYKVTDCKIDYNKNANCKDIEDFSIFVNEYKKYQNTI